MPWQMEKIHLFCRPNPDDAITCGSCRRNSGAANEQHCRESALSLPEGEVNVNPVAASPLLRFQLIEVE
jgi:succinate dehydrogenase/fumarate reductase-like Fe-S protein